MNTRVWKSWFIVQLCKEIPPLFSLFSKLLETCFFSELFLFFKVRGKTSKKFHFIPINAKLSLLSSKKNEGTIVTPVRKPRFLKILIFGTEAVIHRCSAKKVFLKFSQNSQENTCARVSFLMKLPEAHNFIYKGDSGTDATL